MHLLRALIAVLLASVLIVAPATPVALRAACATACPEMKARAEAARKPACCMAKESGHARKPSCCGHETGPGLSVNCPLKQREHDDRTLAVPVPSKVTASQAGQSCPVVLIPYAEFLRSDPFAAAPDFHPPGDQGDSINLRFCTLLC